MTERAHSRTSGKTTEPLYDVDVPTPTHAERARTLVSGMKTGTLATIGREPEGYPYGSFVTVAFDEGAPVFLISELAEHTRNLRKDRRASLLVAEGGAEDPLANARVTLLGLCAPVEGDGGAAREAYLASHPNASYYADYGDFSFWRLDVESIRYIGGYGRMSWVSREEWLAAKADPIAPAAAAIIAHMNDDHGDTMVTLCRAFSKATDTTSATMTSVDRYGFEMSAVTGDGPRPIRLAFSEPVSDGDGARKALIAMLGAARAELAKRGDG